VTQFNDMMKNPPALSSLILEWARNRSCAATEPRSSKAFTMGLQVPELAESLACSFAKGNSLKRRQMHPRGEVQ
jgi:hypothetical protein